MQYKVTKQYSYSIEIFFAEFNEINDASILIKNLLTIDEKQDKQSIYRIYDNNTLIQVCNSGNTHKKKVHAQYADGNCKLPSTINDPFNIIIRNTPNSELILAKFNNLIDARNFAAIKLQTDNIVDVIYYIFDKDKFLEKYDKSTIDTITNSQEKKKVFRPTPLPNRPILGPNSYWVDEDDDKK